MSEQGYVHKPYGLPSLLEVHQQSSAAGAASRDTEVRELREKLEAAEATANMRMGMLQNSRRACDRYLTELRESRTAIARVEALRDRQKRLKTLDVLVSDLDESLAGTN